ncbi:phosphotransferase family protein [Bacillus sp. HMF5848]|uniref:phosphotransferase family protein n=1 Tax=Bacillus sp. HMF5848 TaxID=2495421 RepID=UPI000F7A4658|nr:phosphotransferase family protein [Bacillus sp. HMF5848]RSK27363.1 phosphotransferase family protein [Bacillus sp. HMF5848]
MSTAYSDTIPVRSGEELNINSLHQYLKEHLTEYPANINEELSIRQFGAGHSNLTYELSVGSWQAVLRRPPLGPIAPKAHDMEREHFILQEINPYFKVAPRPLHFCDDASVIGSHFLLMERKQGIVLDTSFPDNMNFSEDMCERVSQIMVDQLVNLHSIDYKATKLASITKPDGFLERQVHSWIKRFHKAKIDEVSGLDHLTNYLASSIPTSGDSTIIHYDYKLNNAMLSEDATSMVGLFDWEMTTVGDPLADLGVAMSYWIEADDPELLKTGLGKPPVTIHKGFYTREKFIESYAKNSGRDVTNIDFYLTFAYFKLAVICQQIYYRFKKGQTNDPRFAKFPIFVESLVKYALQTVHD